MSAWFYLILAGILEIGFTTAMKLSNGFSLERWPFILALFLCGGVSFYLLSDVMKTIPIGTAYGVWTGIGAAGTAIIGMVFFGDAVSFARVALLAVLLGSVVGLKYVG